MTATSGLTFKLHPLVILNISDHHTRVKAQRNGTGMRVLGCVLGIQTGRTVEIFNSFELKYDVLSDAAMVTEQDDVSMAKDANGAGNVVLDSEFLQTKIEQYKKVFPKYEVLGWYSTGVKTQDSDMAIHRCIMERNESPIYVLVNPAINHAGKELPVTIFESELHVIEGVPSLIFGSSSYTIETVEAERISVDHVAHIKPSDGSSAATQLAAHLTGMHSAIKMLNVRIKVLHNLLVSIKRGETPTDHALVRQIASLVRRLPAMDSPNFQQNFLMEYNDTLVLTYMASITKGTSAINELVDKINMAYDKQRPSTGPLGGGVRSRVSFFD